MHRKKWQHCLPLQLPKMLRLEGTSKDNLVYSSMGKGTQMRLSGSVRPHIENLQPWRLHHVSGEFVPVHDCSYCKQFLPYIDIKPFPLELVPIAVCLLRVGPCEEKYSILFLSAPKSWNTVTRCSLSSSPGTEEPSP